MISFDHKILIPDHVLFRELEGESVILNLENDSYFGLDDVGTRFWQTLKESETIQTAYDVLLREYDVAPDALEHDLNELLEELIKRGLVEIAA